ncbi:MAG: hypothetical protein IKD94_06390, partial [Erysipelotrichaceae bacterium]|nr:hypothetical protein [Erysipelotrichaceae bacterium]
AILDQLEEHHLGEYDPYTPLEMPESVTQFTHTKGAYPYASGGGEYGTVTGYIAKKSLEDHPLVSVSEAYKISMENVKKINGGVGNIAGMFDGTTVVATFGAANGGNGVCVGDGCDLSTTNIYGQTTYANGRIWFPHWSAVYTGVALPPYLFTVTLDTGEVISGTTDDTGFSVDTGGGSKAQVCISSATSTSQACVTLYAH